MNHHMMTTRSKAKDNETNINPEPTNIQSDDEIDEHGNLKDFIDYDSENDPKAMEELKKQLYFISNGSDKFGYDSTPKKNKRRNRNKKKDKNLNNIVMSYLIMKATDKANNELKKKNKLKKKKQKQEIEFIEQLPEEDTPLVEEVIEEAIEDSDIETDIETDIELDIESGTEEEFEGSESEGSSPELIDDKKEEDEEIEEEDEEFLFEYDELDEKYEEIMDKQLNQNSEDYDIEYFHNLPKETKEKLIKDTKKIYELNEKNIPMRFKIINSEMDIKTKAIAIENIDKLCDMDVSTGEYSKMDHWITGLIRIPFGKYKKLPVLPESSIQEKRNFIQETYRTLDKAIYGHNEAKTHILQVIGKWIKNPDSGGNVLAIQGPMGNGKTTLVKEGISKVLNRPFAFIALGGASDSAFFDGHSYTYEGSHWGRIVQIIQDSKCMNPIIYFDELDKISDTQKGDEIVHMLTHLTDPSQNSLFQDNYFPGVNLDLSKVLFIFSYNDESRVNRILKDRMYVIHTKGFKTEDKLKIAREYLLPDLMNTFNFEEKEIIFTDEILKNIVDNYTQGEEGVRNLKRCIETIISKINIYMLSYSEDDTKSIDNLAFKIKDFKFPLELNRDHIESLLSVKSSNKPPFHMYV